MSYHSFVKYTSHNVIVHICTTQMVNLILLVF
jgi:hypothetical protein